MHVVRECSASVHSKVAWSVHIGANTDGTPSMKFSSLHWSHVLKQVHVGASLYICQKPPSTICTTHRDGLFSLAVWQCPSPSCVFHCRCLCIHVWTNMVGILSMFDIFVPTYIHTYILYIYKHTCIHTYIHTYIGNVFGSIS